MKHSSAGNQKTRTNRAKVAKGLHLQWTPTHQANDVIDRLSRQGNEAEVQKRFGEMLTAVNLSGDDVVDAFDADRDAADQMGMEAYFLIIACAYCAETIQAELAEDLERAWVAAHNASYWGGVYTGVIIARDTTQHAVNLYKTKNARQAADARHAENKAIKAQAIAYYLANKARYPTKDAAAEAISKQIVPAKYRTVREWLSKLK